jgi:hypothetical protein
MQRIGPLAGYVVHLIPKRPEPDSRRELSVTDSHYTASAGKLEMCICVRTACHRGITGLSPAHDGHHRTHQRDQPCWRDGTTGSPGISLLSATLVPHCGPVDTDARSALGTGVARTVLVQLAEPSEQDRPRRHPVSYIQITDIALSYTGQPRYLLLA